MPRQDVVHSCVHKYPKNESRCERHNSVSFRIVLYFSYFFFHVHVTNGKYWIRRFCIQVFILVL